MKHLHLIFYSLIILSGFSPGVLFGESPPDGEPTMNFQNPMADVNDPVSQVFVSSNTMSRVGIYSILTDESIFKWGFKNFADDADGIYYDAKNDAIYQLNRSENVIDAYSNVNESFQNGDLPPRLTSRSFSRFENGREVAVYNNRMVIAQDASPANGDENELVIYSVKPRGIGYEKTYSVDINLWGITLDRNDLYAVVDNSNKIAFFKSIFNNRDRSNVDPDEIYEVQGLTRTHGITYYEKEDLMILTDIGDAGSANDGGLIIIHNFSSASNDNYISRDEQIRIYGNNTHLGNPVDVAYDPAFNMIYVAERANKGGQFLGFEMPTNSGNFAPGYDDLFPGASSVNLHSFAGDLVLPEERTGQLFVSSNTQPIINVLNVSNWNNIKARKMKSQAMDADGIYFDWEEDLLYQLNRTENVVNTYSDVNKMLDFNKDPVLEYTSSSDFVNGREIAASNDRMVVAQDASDANESQNALIIYSISSGQLSFDQKFNVSENLWGIHLADADLWAIEDNSNRLLQFRNIFAQSGDSISPSNVYEIEGIVRTHGISYSAASDAMFLTDVGDAGSDSDGAFVIIYNFSSAAQDGVISLDEQMRVEGDETQLGNPVDIAFDAVNQMIYIAERANQGGQILGFRTPNTSGNSAPVYSKKFAGASAVYFAGEDQEVEAPAKISQFFVSSNTEGTVGTFDVFNNNMLEMNSFKVKGDDADGLYFNRSQDALYQINRSANRLVAYSDINKSLDEGKNPRYTGHSLKDFTNGRGLASHSDRLVVAQDASAENNFENKLYIYVVSPTTFGLFKTYDVDFNVWGITLDGPHMYAVEDNSNKIAYIKNFFNYREGKVEPTEEYIIEDLVRTHGITYDSQSDVMVLTDIGSAASDSDGALVIIHNFKQASADNIIRTGEQIRISGSKTHLGNPVDVAFDPEENEIYVAERAKSGGLVLAFDVPESSGNFAPYYSKEFPGASSIDRAGVPQEMEEPRNQPEIVVEDPGFGSDILVTSRLTGGAEVPSVETDAVGVATVHFNEDRTMGTINVTVSGLSSSFAGAHIHEAPSGENGDVLINMSDSYTNGRITQSFEITDSLMTKLLEGHLYVNVHTENNPGGELRGQLSLEAPHSYTGWMSGSSEVPSVEADASGLVTAHYTPNTNILELNAQWSGLTGPITGAHLHMGSAGENGDVVENLTDLVIGESIKIKIEAGDYIEALNAGEIYLNVHTEANPGGEIRAQLAPTHGVVIDTWMTGGQEAPSADNNGIGLGLFVLDSELETVDYWVQTSSLTGPITGAHIHSGELGVSGDVVLNLTDGIDGWTIQGEDASVSADLVNTMLSGDNYINVHTEAFPAGEVRGQLYRLARDGYAFNICPDQQVNAPVMADSVSGSGIFAFNRGMDEAHLMVVSNELSSDFAGSHIHNGVMGEDGDVILNFSDAFMNNGAFLYFTDSSATPMTSEFAELVRMGETYVNIHTENNPGGELRGQIIKELLECGVGVDTVNQPEIVVEDPGFGSDILVTSRLTGGAEVPSVETDAVGVATVHFNEDRTMGTINVTVSGLSSSFAGAHIHEAPSGENGDVLINMSDSYTNGRITQSFEITDSLMTKLLEGHLYVNVHTENNPGGELRGQLSLEAPHSYTGWMSGSSEVPSVEADASGLVTAHYTPNTNILELNAQWSGLTGPITGAHLHMGSAGENGDVVENLTDLVIGESIKIKIEAGDYIEALNAGEIYLNVHTEANPGGEIRAQLAPTHGVVIDTWMTGGQEAPSADNNGIGLGLFVLDSELETVDYWVQTSSLTGPITGAHIHSGELGVSGDVVLNLTDGIDGWTIQGEDASVSADLVNTMLSGDNYINVHTEAFPAGEVRGQLYRLARDGYAFNICPDQQVNAPVMADSVSGSGIFAFNRGMDEAHLMVVSNELSSDFAGSHIHNGVMGEDGDVILNFSDAFMNNGAFLYFTDSSATPMTSEFAELVRMGETYVNIHTENNPGGELRGQIIKELLECGFGVDSTGLKPVPDEVEVSVFPNPVANYVSLEFPTLSPQEISSLRVSIINYQGDVVRQINNASDVDYIDVSSLSSGIYFVRVIGRDGVHSKKFLKK
ncbi:CHRD domain-containing protein [Membranihabitans maritimus]|uniref:CHRD domain-containing protein n=1 Tax=Membranihabitans maritimus TaxID=2904244 RepID=UPI001F251B30|nr:CHRD domain-containing protein [Membranihabitans maritimus]